MKWSLDIPPKEVIEENKKLLEKYPFLERKNIFSGEGYDGEAKYYSTSYDYWNGSGWEKIWKKFIDKLGVLWSKLPDDDFKNKFQIWDTKEKYGTLRVSLPGGTEEMHDLVSALSSTSLFTCYCCGKQPRDSRGNRLIWLSKGWIAPYCKTCAKEFYIKQMKHYYGKIKVKGWKEDFKREVQKGPFTISVWDREGKHVKELEDI